MTIEQAQDILNRAAEYCADRNAIYANDPVYVDVILANGYADAVLLLEDHADMLEAELLMQDWKQERNTGRV